MKQVVGLILLWILFTQVGIAQQTDTGKVDMAIEKCLHYFRKKCADKEVLMYIQPLFKPIYSYYRLEGGDFCFRYTDREDSLYLASFAPLYLGEAKTGYLVKNFEWSPIDSLTLFALYGTRIMSKKRAMQTMEKFISDMNYEMTHSYLALLLLENTRYIQKKKLASIKARNIEAMYRQLEGAQEKYSDIEVECIALLLYGGEQVKGAYIEKLIETQELDGSWLQRGDAEENEMRDHTSILGLWALLEWKFGSDKTLYLAKRKGTN